MHLTNSGSNMGIGAGGGGLPAGIIGGGPPGGSVNLVNNYGHNGDSRPPPPPHTSLLHMAGNDSTQLFVLYFFSFCFDESIFLACVALNCCFGVEKTKILEPQSLFLA